MDTDTDVVIVGAGPNGLMLANELVLAGVRPVVLERLPRPATLPKANGLVGRVVQVLHRRGWHEAITGSTEPPRPAPSFQFGALPLDMSTLDHSMFVLPVPQRTLEQVLADGAIAGGVPIRRGHEVTGMSQDDGRVAVDVRAPGTTYRLTARFLVGADGGRSTVRKRLGIGFPGLTDDGFTHRMGRVVVHPPVALPDTGQLDVPGMGLLSSGTFHRTEHGVFAFGVFQPGVYRVAVIEWGPSGLGDTDDMPLEELRAATKRVLGTELPMDEPDDGQPSALVRGADGINSRIAERYRQGRVLLLGDAAHVQSGMGGPGLNLGLQDAVNLGWKLAAEVHGWAPAGLLDSYERERRPVAERVLMHSRAQTALISQGPNVTALREVFTELLRDESAVRRVSDLMSGADTRYDMGTTGPLVGRWLPDVVLGDATTIAGLSRSGRPLLLDLAGRTDLREIAAGWADRVDVHTTTADLAADAVLVRPDGYVAWAGGDGLADALCRWFGPPR